MFNKMPSYILSSGFSTFILGSGFSTFISSALSIWSVVCMWIIFKKAGRKGWEAIIPVWNAYILFKIAGKKSYFWIIMIIPILWFIYLILIRFVLSRVGVTYEIILWGSSFLLLLICWLELTYGLAKKFGKSNWFYIGMLFLTPIHFGILAFSDAQYKGLKFNEKYNWKFWILITIGISLVAVCDSDILFFLSICNKILI